jgi:DNA (cytosine-5)-methyltransferase 1
MTHGSLFSGIGGFDLAARWCGWINVFQCENDAFCQRVLKYHFPNTILHGDIKTADFTGYRGTIDVLSGGFPCQPFSQNGKRKGADDDRYLWPEMLRVIREVQPAWVVAENVYGLLTQQHGVVFEQVCVDLERAGYEVQPFIIPACAVDAPHRRNRVWIVAHRAGTETTAHAKRNDAGRYGHGKEGSPHGETESERTVTGYEKSLHTGERRTVAHANTIGLEYARPSWTGIPEFKDVCRPSSYAAGCRRLQNDESEPEGQLEQVIPDWRDFPTQSPICRRDDGVSHGLYGITFSAWRRNSIGALGNAIVPQVAYEIFKIIDKI